MKITVGLLVYCCVLLVGCKNREMGLTLKNLMQTSYFRIVVVDDEHTVELCGALKVSH